MSLPVKKTRSSGHSGAEIAVMHNSLQNRGLTMQYSVELNNVWLFSSVKRLLFITETYWGRIASHESVSLAIAGHW